MSFFGEKIFPASLDALNEIRNYVLAAASKTDLEKKKTYKLQLAIDEIATNIISYGYQRNEGQAGKIYIDAEFLKHSLVIYLKDSGTPFDPRCKLQLEQGNLTTSVKERRIGGLGIYLAITGVDNFDYEYQDGFNVNRFESYIDNVG